MLNAGDDGALEPENEERRDEGCFSLSIGGGGNIELAVEAVNAGVEATDVAGVSGAASLSLLFEVPMGKDRSSLLPTSLTVDSTSLTALSRLGISGRVAVLPLAVEEARASLITLGVLPCLLERTEPDAPMLMLMLVLRPIA